MALPSPSCQPAYPHQQGPVIPSSVFSSDRDLQELVNRRDMRISSTHDLAEFLRSSKPEDYSRPAKTADDLALDTGHRKISFKFLKSASKDFLSPRKHTVPVPVPSNPALPEKVRSEKTSKGNSYLAIQVDYTPASDDALASSLWTPSSSDSSTRNSFQNATFAESSSDRSNYRNSLTSQAWKEQDQAYQAEFDTFALPTDTRGVSRWMRNSSGSELSTSRIALLTSSPAISHTSTPYSTAKSDRVTASIFPNKNSLPEGSMAHHHAPLSALRKPVSNPALVQRRYSSDSTVRASPMSAHSPRLYSRVQQDGHYIPNTSPISVAGSTSDDGALFTGPQSKDAYPSMASTPAQPGPPPNRDLPSLPEGHGDAINLASKIRAAAAARSSISSQLSLTSDMSSLKSRRAGTPIRARSQREISVKARKIKDLEEIRNRRSLSQSDFGSYSDAANLKHKKSRSSSSHLKNHGLKSDPITFSPITVVYEVAPDDEGKDDCHSDEASDAQPRSEPRGSVSSAASSEALPLQARQSMDLPLGDFPSTPRSYAMSPSDSAINLEARMSFMERKNHLLEQALLAVLRSAICMDTGPGMDGNGLSEIVNGLANFPTPSCSK